MSTTRELEEGGWSALVSQGPKRLVDANCSVLLDKPFHVLVRCSMPHVVELDSREAVSLELLQHDVRVSSQQLCFAALPRTKHKIAICTQPLFSPDTKYAEPDEREVAKSQKLAKRFRALVWQWVRYHLMLGVSHVYLYDRDDSFGGLVSSQHLYLPPRRVELIVRIGSIGGRVW